MCCTNLYNTFQSKYSVLKSLYYFSKTWNDLFLYGILKRVMTASWNLCKMWEKRNHKHEGSKKDGKDQESIQSSTTPDPGYQWEINKLTTRHHKREPRGQLFPSRWPQGINKQTRTKAQHTHKTEITWIIHKRSTALERASKIFNWRA